MRHYSFLLIPLSLLTPICALLLISSFATAASPPPNTIPVIAMNAGQDSSCLLVTPDLLCELSWRHFDGVWVLGHASHTYIDDIMEWCDERDMLVVHATPRLGQYADPSCAWARFDSDINETNAFIHPDTSGLSIDSTFTAVEMAAHINFFCAALDSLSAGYNALWFWDIFNEAPSHQWAHMTKSEFPGPYDDYYPDVFTQDTHFDEVEPDGVFSWVKHRMGELVPDVPVSLTLGCFHRAYWAAMGFPYGYFYQQANCVAALRDMMYQGYDSTTHSLTTPVANGVEFLDSNTYPFRQVGTVYQDTADWIPGLGDSLNTWILDHYEEGMDSTFIPAGDLPIHLHTQVFGMCGGTAIWSIDSMPHQPPETTLVYVSGTYRIPTPAEFLMECNLGLVRDAEGIFPFSLRSYDEWSHNHYYAGLLDKDLVPYDAPYEEWVYRDRPTEDYFCVPPDSYPPFIDTPYDYDPLYDLPTRPIQVPGSQRNQENYLLWKFAPYGRLWKSMREALGQIAVVAPRMSGLEWWSGHEEDALIEPPLPLPQIWTSPEIKVFTDSTESVCCLFYVNRQCRDSTTRYTISVDEGDFPSGTLTEFVLDLSRRFLIPVDEDNGIYSFQDTLEAGQGRLVEFVDPPLDVDIRITAPDISAFTPGTAIEVYDFEFTAGDEIEIRPVFYNMGTEEAEDVVVTCFDLTENDLIGLDTLDFDGLSTNGWSCDSRRATFTWETHPVDIGVHVLEFRAEALNGEPDTLDNAARAVFLIRPRDYAETILENPWDMTEDLEDPPDWYTSDVSDLVGWETGSTLTDSVSGMFEGTVADPSETNRLYLRVGRNDPVDPGIFHQLSLAGMAPDRPLSLYVGWRNEEDSVCVVDTGLDVDTVWAEIGPVDLDALSEAWTDADIESFWLEFNSGSPLASSIRLGWVCLTE